MLGAKLRAAGGSIFYADLDILAFYDPLESSSVFTDTDGTAVASTSDTVLRINDLSGNGYDATIATGTNGPILDADGYLNFSGKTRLYAQIPFSPDYTFTICVVVDRDGYPSDNAGEVSISNRLSSSRHYCSLFASQLGIGQWRLLTRAGSGNIATDIVDEPTYDNRAVLVGEYKNDGSTLFSLNNNTVSFGMNEKPVGLNTICIGGIEDSDSRNTEGRIAAVLVINGSLTEQDKSDLDYWAKSRYGVV